MNVLARSRLTSKEQLSLPARVRRLLGVKAGDELVWSRDDSGRLVVEPARRYSLEEIRRSVAELGPVRKARPVSVASMKKAIAARAARRHGRR